LLKLLTQGHQRGVNCVYQLFDFLKILVGTLGTRVCSKEEISIIAKTVRETQ